MKKPLPLEVVTSRTQRFSLHPPGLYRVSTVVLLVAVLCFVPVLGEAGQAGASRKFEVVTDPTTGTNQQVYLTGKVTDQRDGVVWRMRSYVDGYLEGPTVRYYPSGATETITHYWRGEFHGEVIDYFDNGHLKRVSEYAFGKKHGKEVIYDSDARDGKTLRMEEHFEEGTKVGQSRSWSGGELQFLYFWVKKPNSDFPAQHGAQYEYSDGKLDTIKRYRVDRLHGLTERFLEDGTLKSQHCYVDGSEQTGLGPCTGATGKETVETKHRNGKLASSYEVRGGEFHGFYKTFYDSGERSTHRNYKDGKLHGEQLEWDEEGRLKSRSNYKAGKREGKSTTYWDNGELRMELSYREGYLHGMSRATFDSGKDCCRAEFVKGRRHGVTEYLSEEGTVLSRESYRDGELSGKAFYFFLDGQPWTEVVYKDNRRVSMVRFGADGKVGERESYNDDGSVK